MSNLTRLQAVSSSLDTAIDKAESLPDASGGDYKGEYSVNTTYVVGDVVLYNGNLYQCTNDTTAGQSPLNDPIYWNGGTPLNTVNDSYKGEYSDSTEYAIGDIVVFQGNVYRCSGSTTAGYNPVDNPIYWNDGTPLNTNSSSSGSSVDTCTVTVTGAYAGSGISYTAYENGQIMAKEGYGDGNFENVVCGSAMTFGGYYIGCQCSAGSFIAANGIRCSIYQVTYIAGESVTVTLTQD